VYLGASFAPVIFDETEGQYAGAAREMLASGNWWVPTNDGLPRLQKPPLLYWLLCVSLATFGRTEFAARLPNALATLGWIAAVYLIGKRVGGQKRGVAAAGIFGSMIGLFIFAHLIMPEPLLGMWISLTFWCLVSAWPQPASARRWFLGAWIFMGLGVITKGLHGALYPLITASVCALLYPSSRRFWRGLWSWQGLGIFLALVLPWYIAMARLFPGFLADHFMNEQVGHLFDNRFPRDSSPVPSTIFWLQHLLFFFPWTLFLPAAIWVWRRRRAGLVMDRMPEALICIWAILTAASILVSARQDYYTMTAWGAVAIWLAPVWSDENRLPRAWLVAPCVGLVALGAAVAVWAQIAAGPASAAPIAAKPAVARGDLFSSLTGFSFGAWRDCLALIKGAGLALLLGGGVATGFAWLNRKRAAAIALGLSMVVCFAMVIKGYSFMGEYFSLAQVGKAVSKAARPDALVVCEGEPHLNASLFFYLDRQVLWIHARPDNEFALRSLHVGQELYPSEERLAEWWHSPRQVFLITESSNLPKWKAQLGPSAAEEKILGRSGTRVVIVNR
jgi:4-amino-4-deoxy-L-arabinose transferase-like glycosyltransferase